MTETEIPCRHQRQIYFVAGKKKIMLLKNVSLLRPIDADLLHAILLNRWYHLNGSQTT